MYSKKKIVRNKDLEQLGAEYRKLGKKVVWTNGCFDIVHIGHIRGFELSKSFGDILVVGVNSDGSIKKLKGESRPIICEDDRLELLSAIQYIDHVVLFDDDTPENILSLLKPDIHCKGEDYKPPHGKMIPEKILVESYGGEVRFIPFVKGKSTSQIIKAISELNIVSS
jgi:D-glycero-beta-D-manno-heptose 1-phosphate adenylyltransferase